MYDNSIFEHAGHKFRFRVERDDDHGAPWDEEDGHGPVSGWTRNAKAPGEMVLCSDRGAHRYYDFAEAVRIARRDGWDSEPYGTGTRGERAHRAAMADFNRLRQWCADLWCYVGVTVSLLDDDGDPMGESLSLWGIESDAGGYLDAVARELADELLDGVARQLRAA